MVLFGINKQGPFKTEHTIYNTIIYNSPTSHDFTKNTIMYKSLSMYQGHI